ncbi:hypothetical protein BGZ49_007169 [Haplosporangium sp. Z 27]|nr:hypothetical protein BGZ49_007169 [Haplosporangium sp. Z 27]
MTWSVNCSGLSTSHHVAPKKFSVNDRHLREFCTDLPQDDDFNTKAVNTEQLQYSYRLKEPISIKPLDFYHYLLDGLKTSIRDLMHPSAIPGKSLGSRIYALGLLPGLLAVLIFVKVDTVDPSGTEEALKQISDTQPRKNPNFNYYIANLLLILSTVTYERDDKLVKDAFNIMNNITNESEKAQAAAFLEESERSIDEKAMLLGMRFMGISELKSLGGQYAGLFYNDEAIILVYKGTSVLAFNEYLIDGTITRVDASEYLYGEVHKGFYECLFPDTPQQENDTINRYNPFDTVMATIFDVATKLKARTGKPVNLWMTGHSLGGALAALTVARLQLPLRANDPLFKGYEPAHISLNNKDGTPRTVLQEMLHRYNDFPSSSASTVVSSPVDSTATTPTTASHGPISVFSRIFHRHSDDGNHEHHDSPADFFHRHLYPHSHDVNADDLIVLRDCYSFASPRLGDTPFAKEFDKNHTRYFENSPYKPVYYRVMVDKDIVPMLPPSCNAEMDEGRERMFPCVGCPKKSKDSSLTSTLTSVDDASAPLQQHSSQPVNYGSVDQNLKPENTKNPHLHSLLDYRHVGQMICLPNLNHPPIVKPSAYQTNLCANVLRSDDSTKELLLKIDKVLNIKPDIKDPTQFPITPENIRANTVAPTTFNAEAIIKQMRKDKAIYDLDVISRLRIPCTAEKFLLSFPNVISHSPSAYQRNLARTRFYFTSFPGTNLENLIHGKRPTEGMFAYPDSGVVVQMESSYQRDEERQDNL